MPEIISYWEVTKLLQAYGHENQGLSYDDSIGWFLKDGDAIGEVLGRTAEEIKTHLTEKRK